jgi:hypothetical protein
MSLPTEFDFATLEIGDGATPTEVFTISCGKTDLTINTTASSNDRFVRDCAKPGEIPFRKTRVTGRQMDITATGLTDATAYGNEIDLVGARANVKVKLYADDGTDAGDLIGTIALNALVSALNVGVPRDGDSSAEITLASHGAWTWTAA